MDDVLLDLMRMQCSDSRTVAPPFTGRIAVKVINDYGDEVLQDFEV